MYSEKVTLDHAGSWHDIHYDVKGNLSKWRRGKIKMASGGKSPNIIMYLRCHITRAYVSLLYQTLAISLLASTSAHDYIGVNKKGSIYNPPLLYFTHLQRLKKLIRGYEIIKACLVYALPGVHFYHCTVALSLHCKTHGIFIQKSSCRHDFFLSFSLSLSLFLFSGRECYLLYLREDSIKKCHFVPKNKWHLTDSALARFFLLLTQKRNNLTAG